MQINIQDIWSKGVRKTHKKYVVDILDKATFKPGSYLELLIDRHGRNIATAIPKRLRSIIADVKIITANATSTEYTDFLDECKNLFDYKSFSDKKTKGWNAYAMCATSKYQTCPYCQQAGALTVFRERGSKSFRPTLDHFYPKAQYPYLALSLYNLVPSCHTCNSSLKTTTDFYEDEHLHPFEDDELIRFEWDIEKYIRDRLFGGPAGGSLHLNGVSICTTATTHPKYAAIQNSINTFLFEEKLLLNLASLLRFQETLLTYSPERLAETNRKVLSPSGWTLTQAQALQFSYDDYKNEWFGRLKADLYDAAWIRT